MGSISGVLVAVGGVAYSSRPLPGTVRISGEGHVFTRIVPADGRFHAEVPIGTYIVTGGALCISRVGKGAAWPGRR